MGGIAGMCVSPDGKRATTVGRDGLFGVWALGSEPRRDVPLQDVPFRIADQDELVQVKEEEAVYTVKAERQHLAALRAQHGDHRAQVIDRISQLRDALQHFKLENSEAAAEEKLETQAFMLASQREAIEELGRQKMAEKEEDIKWCNLAKDYVAHNLKRDNYDAMDAHLLVLHGLTGAQQPKVPSYTIRKVSHKEKVILRKLKFLREVEIAEWNRRKNFEGLDNLVADPPPAEEEDAEAAEEKDPDAVEEDEPETADPTLDEEATLPVDHLLYNKYMSYTRSRAVTQMTLFQQQISVLRRAFNEKIVEGLDRKKTDLSRIAEKYVRVKQIRKELDLPDEDPPSYYVAAEHPERVLLVEDAEIEALASATRQAIIALDAAEQDGALKNTSADNDEKETNEKALKVMMDNRLERDERTVAEIKVPSFADPENKDYKPTEEWTDDEQRLFKEYEKKLQKRQEEEDKRCRLLQGELKDTLREVAKICDDHADFLVKLYDTKLNVDAEVGKLDVQIIKLAQSLVQEEEMAKHYQRLVTVVSEVRDETSHAVHLAQEAQRELQTKRDRWEDLLANEKKKTGDKEIRQQPPFSEAEEYAETLIKLLKKSTRPRRDKAAKANREDRDRKQLIDASPDPFSFLEEDEDDAKKPKQPVATDTVSDFKLDKPEGLRDDLWKEFLDFRRERLEYEKEQKILYDALQELAKVTDTLTRESRAQQDKLAERVQLLHDFKRQMIKESYNLDVLYTFKQGKIEVEQEAVVTDYADGILIRKELIEALNEQIREHGRAKVDKMREIVEFKKNIRSIEWENRMLQHEVDVCEMEYKHLHTLRVTKAMQEFIKGGSESHHDLERSSILKKIDHVRASMAAKIEEKRQATLKVKRIVKDREAENAALEEQVKAARQIVCQREDITRLQSTGLDHQRNLKLMKDVRVTRKLEDVAKAQQEEMKLLKKEVDRLREATFPSFAVVSKRVVGNPDEL
ncbi:Cilia- and flagella-associated protein 43 [Diplonema papillatum]|nr:Cilia- and flagella-associated protein 43 [Diplonema papillatum]